MTEHITHHSDRVHIIEGYWTPAHIVYSILDIVEVLLALRLVFKLFGANAGNGLVNFLYGITQPLVTPFAGIFPTPERIFFEWSTLIAMLAYAILAYLIVRLFKFE